MPAVSQSCHVASALPVTRHNAVRRIARDAVMVVMVRRTWSLMRFRRAPVPTFMILLANSTPMVCDDKTLHSLLTKRCKRQDLREMPSQRLGLSAQWRLNSLSRATGT